MLRVRLPGQRLSARDFDRQVSELQPRVAVLLPGGERAVAESLKKIPTACRSFICRRDPDVRLARMSTASLMEDFFLPARTRPS